MDIFILVNLIAWMVVVIMLAVSIYKEERERKAEARLSRLLQEELTELKQTGPTEIIKEVEVIKEIPVLSEARKPKRGYRLLGDIEVSNRLHNRIKRFAAEKNLAIDLATIKVLRKGLSSKKKRSKRLIRIRKKGS